MSWFSDIAYGLGLSAPLLTTLMIVWVGLVSITSVVMIKDSPQNLRARLWTWWIITGLLTAVLLLGTLPTLILFGIISFLALKEYLTMIPTRRVDRAILLWAYLSIPIQYYLIGIEWYGLFIIFIPIYLFLSLPAFMVMRGETDGFLRAAGTLHWGVMLAVFAISHAAYLLEGLPAETGAARFVGGELLLYLLILTALNDVLQYTAGKLMGGKIFRSWRPARTVSPNKTWEGVIGGLLGTIFFGGLLSIFLTPIHPLHGLMLGGILSIAGLLGDLTISALKRDIGLKDSGTLLPGHGGMLDRVDSLVFTAPLFLHIVRYLYF